MENALEVSRGASVATRPPCRTDTGTSFKFCTAPTVVRPLQLEPAGRETTTRIARGPAHCGMPARGSTSLTKTRTHLCAGLPSQPFAST